MTTTERYNEVTAKLDKMFKKADENGKDDMVSSLKFWLKNNRNTEDKGKKQAIELFLENN